MLAHHGAQGAHACTRRLDLVVEGGEPRTVVLMPSGRMLLAGCFKGPLMVDGRVFGRVAHLHGRSCQHPLIWLDLRFKSNDLELSLERERAAFVCRHVFEGTRPIRLVAHEEGDWQFLCGEEHGPGDGPRVVGLNHLVERDPSIVEVLELQEGWEAERHEVGGPWGCRPIGE